MDIAKILDQLRQERQRLDEAILVIDRLMASAGKHRGRRPNWLKQVESMNVSPMDSPKPGTRKKFGAETRRKMAEAQKRRWKAKHAEKNG